MERKAVKKVLTFLFAGILLVSLAGCSGTGNQEQVSKPGSLGEGEIPASGNPDADGLEDAGVNEEEDSDISKGQKNGEILVAYFSATGTTKTIARYIADRTGADLFEIKPVEPYTEEDLNYNDDSCRANKEQSDKSARPEIAEAIDNMDSYQTVFIGFPIWWGEEPRIIDTFMESYDLSGKTLIPFCTSGSSGIGKTDENLQAKAPGANWLGGKRYGAGASKDSVNEWVDTLELEKETGKEMSVEKLGIQVGDAVMTAVFEDNSSAKALIEELKKNPIVIEMEDYANFEKVGALGLDLPRNDEQITTEPGDVILYMGNQLTIYYDTNSWNFTKIARIEGLAQKELKDLLGDGDVTVTLFLQ